MLFTCNVPQNEQVGTFVLQISGLFSALNVKIFDLIGKKYFLSFTLIC